MYTLTVKNNRGEMLTLSNNPAYCVYKITGLTPPQATINASVNTTSDGSRVNNVRLENRNIVIYTTIEGDCEKNRLNLYKYFPVKREITLYFSHGSREVHIEGVVELIECDIFASKQIAQISIICPKPYFKAAETLVNSFGDVASRFEFPFSIPKAGIEFSTSTANQRKSIINTGDVDTGVIIELFAIGTVANPVVYNVFTNGKIMLNCTMAASDKIVINTNVGEKSITLIRNGVSTNAMGYMSPDSEWFVITNGDNVFTYDADSGTANLQITFRTSLLYSGV